MAWAVMHGVFAVSFAGSMGSRRDSGGRTDYMSAVRAWCCHTHPLWCGVESSVAQPYLAAVSRSVVGTAQRPERRLACVGMTDGLRLSHETIGVISRLGHYLHLYRAIGRSLRR